MDPSAVVAKVEESYAFLSWKHSKKARLVSLLSMYDHENLDEWFIAYYHDGETTSFLLSKGIVSLQSHDKAPGNPSKLSLDSVKVSESEAVQRAREGLSAQTGERATKVIVLLQCLERQIWNISLMTASYNIFNMRIDSASGETIGKPSYGALFAQA